MFVTLQDFFDNYRIKNGQQPNETVLNRGLMRLKRETNELQSLLNIFTNTSNDEWSSTKNYEIDEYVDYNGLRYKSRMSRNLGNEPYAEDTLYWENIDYSYILTSEYIYDKNEIDDLISNFLTTETVTSLSLVANQLKYTDENGSITNLDLSTYLDDTNLARIISGTYDETSGSLIFTRDDLSTFSVDASMFFDNNNLVTSVNGQTGAVSITPTSVNGQTGAVSITPSNIGAALSSHNHDSRYYTETEVDGLVSNKQNILVSGTNIKTINGTSLLGSGDIVIEGGTVSGDYLPLTGGTLTGDLTVEGNITATSFTGDGSGLTNLPTQDLSGYMPLSGGYAIGNFNFYSNGGSISLIGGGVQSTRCHFSLTNGGGAELSAGVGTGGNLNLITDPTLGAIVDITGNVEVSGTITATGDITSFSDKSLKTNIEVIDNALEKVKYLSGYTFDRTDIIADRQTGVIAQEVQEVLPEAVMERADGTLTVAYGNMVGLLIEAIKEQQTQIDELKEKLNKYTI